MREKGNLVICYQYSSDRPTAL